MNRILLVDDEQEVRQLIRLHLEKNGMDVTECQSGFEAVSQLNKQPFDLIILDLMMDNLDGFEVLQYLNKHDANPLIIVLSARRDIQDKITTLGLGADDYVTKPFSPIELVARVQAHLRRNSSKSIAQYEILRINKFKLDIVNATLHYNEEKHTLTTVECELLKLFMQNTDRVLTKREIYKYIWQHENYDDNNLSVFISRLRKILERTTGLQHIRSVRGVGYQFSGDGF